MPFTAVIALSLTLAGLLAATSCGGDTVPARSVVGGVAPGAAFPKSRVVSGLRIRLDTLVEQAEGSDNWAITWAADGAQYTTWGDGGGFDGTNREGRVSMGVARIDGPPDDFTATNVWGGVDARAHAAYPGKSYGVLAVGRDLWLWRTGKASHQSAFEIQDLFVSRDGALTFQPAGVAFTEEQFAPGEGFFAPTFLQFGPGYRGARDGYVYVYAPEQTNEAWGIQKPGEIALMRVPVTKLADRSAYEFFAGFDSTGSPAWTTTLDERQPVFRDAKNGIMKTSVTWNAGLRRYFLITQQRQRWQGGYIGIYESTEPWGPWSTVLFENAWKIGLQDGIKSVYWNFSNKWTSRNGRCTALVYTGPSEDNFGMVMVELTPPGRGGVHSRPICET